MKKLDLSIIIVTYNSEKCISDCINSIIKFTTDINYEIIIIDNSSVDGTVDMVNQFIYKYEFIKLYKSLNRGFNYANNIGIRNCSGDYIGLLNPDTILINDVFSILLKNMKCYSHIGACGPIILDKNLDKSTTRIFFPSIKDELLRVIGIRNIKSTYYIGKTNKKVDSPTGACYVFRKEIVDLIGYMDENYFLYFDETDYSYRMKIKNLDRYIISEAKLIHLQGKSTEEIGDNVIKYYIESYNRFLDKHKNRFVKGSIKKLFILEYFLKKLFSQNLKKQSFYKEYIIHMLGMKESNEKN